jgi:hypothetical protein
VAAISDSISAALILRNIIFFDKSAGALFSSVNYN